ncbi:hypothetical protein Acid345_3273 [Candidatus Koribacter versatilis Ellin345]|uniref:Lipoprotein n=1 Tax=Koribacter versatilis (strain Ellin345) TaxID=204669 RepID=Q1ILH6_KORVE|nr:hypothetical protein [Candidatus Koribacter versatilis]ABF42274.1 hypothetical protein Acid345_3273 [Candidatus Koribacter versatilis Ellin345]
MNKSLVLAATLFAAATLSLAQTTPAAQSESPQPATPQSSSGMTKPQADTAASQRSTGPAVPAQLAKSIDSKKAKAGDEIDAKTTVGMSGANGLQVPEGSKIVGHITDAKAKSKGDPESSLTFAFEKIVLKDGKELPFRAVAQAIGPGQNAAASAFPESGGPNAPPAKNGMSGGNSSAVGNGPGGSTGGTAGNPSASAATPQGISSQNAAPGRLSENSTGAVGMKGITLDSQSSASKISSDAKSVKLDEGTQLLLKMLPQ